MSSSSTASSTTPFETNDFNIAAFLIASGAHLAGTKRVGNRLTFQFNKKQAKERINLYVQNASVPVRTFIEAQNRLKVIVHRSVGR